MQTANLTHRPMTRSDALKILNLESKDLSPEAIYKVTLLYLIQEFLDIIS